LLRAERCREDVEVSVLLTDAPRIHVLNRQYRNIDGPTDVLSFSQLEDGATPDKAVGAIGDVVISVETARRQAQEQGKDPDDEMDLLVAHGMLHLLGYNDETNAGADEMKRKVIALFGAEIAR
jgi:probable rRNA maturation factor